MNAIALTFQNTHFDVIDRNQQPWLKAPQIAEALGYASVDAISRLYRRNADEFTDSMTGTVNLTVSGNLETETRIFSLRGCHLLAMFARTAVAKEFRKWVLDILEHHTQPRNGLVQLPEPPTKTALPGKLTPEQQDVIKALVKERAEALPKEMQAGATIRCWSAIKKKFGCTYKEVPAENFVNVISLLSRLPLEGELLEKAETIPTLTIDLDNLGNAGVNRAFVQFKHAGLSHGRWLATLSDNTLSVTELDRGEFVTTSEKLPRLIEDSMCLAVEREHIPAIIAACAKRLGAHQRQ